MKNKITVAMTILCVMLFSCNQKLYDSNGESIYKTGKNVKGKKLLDKSKSSIQFIKSCMACHGRKGDRMKNMSIKFTYLSNPGSFSVPYTDSLFFRFLDHDLKSDGTKANIGVIWKMSDPDKKDLLNYLKSL
jgi:hypothetical protein